MKLSQLFDQVYIINLPDRQDRRTEIDAEFAKIGDHTDSSNVYFFPALRPINSSGFPTIGAHGCFLSHLSVLEDALKKGYSRILVLEDDCNFSEALRRREVEVTEALLKDDWDIFYGGSLYYDKSRSNLRAGFYHASVPPDTSIMGAHFIAWRGKAILTACSYLRRILTRPPGHPDGGPMHVDGAYSWLRKDNPELLTRIFSPEIAYQRSSRTDIHETAWFDSNPATRDLVAFARRIKNLLKIGGVK